MRKAMKITIVLALLAVPSAALAAGNASQVQAINCQTLKFKPQRITLSCGDAGTWLGKLKWSSWTKTQAVGTGNYTANNCTPDCASGHTHSVAVKVTLSKPKTCPNQVNPAFKLAVISYKGTRPKGAPLKYNFKCPAGLPGAY
jgi:plastocyanin